MKLRTMILLTLGLASITTEAATIQLKALPPTIRVRQEGAFRGV